MCERKVTKKVMNIDISEDAQVTQEYLDMREFAYGAIKMPAAWTAAVLAFKVATEPDETPVPLYDEAGGIVEVTVAVDGVFDLPFELRGCHYVWLWSTDGAAADEAQLADRQFTVMLKS